MQATVVFNMHDSKLITDFENKQLEILSSSEIFHYNLISNNSIFMTIKKIYIV